MNYYFIIPSDDCSDRSYSVNMAMSTVSWLGLIYRKVKVVDGLLRPIKM